LKVNAVAGYNACAWLGVQCFPFFRPDGDRFNVYLLKISLFLFANCEPVTGAHIFLFAIQKTKKGRFWKKATY
jgi:hypothetical protein